MSSEKSELHITNIDRVNKAMWVAASRLGEITLAEWAIDALNNAADQQILQNTQWTCGLSSRSAICLIRHGFKSKEEVRAAFKNAKIFPKIMNFGRAQNEEVLTWLKN